MKTELLPWGGADPSCPTAGSVLLLSLLSSQRPSAGRSWQWGWSPALLSSPPPLTAFSKIQSEALHWNLSRLFSIVHVENWSFPPSFAAVFEDCSHLLFQFSLPEAKSLSLHPFFHQWFSWWPAIIFRLFCEGPPPVQLLCILAIYPQVISAVPHTCSPANLENLHWARASWCLIRRLNSITPWAGSLSPQDPVFFCRWGKTDFFPQVPCFTPTLT